MTLADTETKEFTITATADWSPTLTREVEPTLSTVSPSRTREPSPTEEHYTVSLTYSYSATPTIIRPTDTHTHSLSGTPSPPTPVDTVPSVLCPYHSQCLSCTEHQELQLSCSACPMPPPHHSGKRHRGRGEEFWKGSFCAESPARLFKGLCEANPVRTLPRKHCPVRTPNTSQ